jgi:hypothetical protein
LEKNKKLHQEVSPPSKGGETFLRIFSAIPKAWVTAIPQGGRNNLPISINHLIKQFFSPVGEMSAQLTEGFNNFTKLFQKLNNILSVIHTFIINIL